VYEGLKNAFLDLGHDFRPYTAEDDLHEVLTSYRPDIFFYSLNFYHRKFLDLELLRSFRREGLVVFCQIRAWHNLTNVLASGSPATGGLKDHEKERTLISTGLAGDIFWHCFEQDEPLMEGFVEATGRRFETVHLAADRTLYFQDPDPTWACDLAYVGSYIPAKRQSLKANVLPLGRMYDLRVYGSDWTRSSRLMGHVQRAGQYFNVRPLKGIRKLVLSLEDERKVYSSARISLNVHEEHCRRTGSETNERTFKILACGGFELCDDVAIVRRFFTEDELVVAKNEDDWFEKIDHYLRNPDERATIAAAGRKKVLAQHTYHHRAQQFLDLAATSNKPQGHGPSTTPQIGGDDTD
jgi:hypothetical protein